jgi:hypothetical protein
MSGEFSGLIILGALWFVLSGLASRGRSAGRRPESRSPVVPRPRPLPSRPDPTQREGLRLETLLGDLQRSLEQVGAVRQEASREVDLDDEAAEIEERRIRAAEARRLPQARKAPAALEQIEPQPAEHTATRSLSGRQLREAIIWREILGPPVSER